MDDLMSLDWTAPASTKAQPKPSPTPPLARQSPMPLLPGRSTPLSAQPSGSSSAFRGIKATSKPATPANDSFSGLLSTAAPKTSNNLTLQERQRQLQEEKARQSNQSESQFGSQDAHFWDALGSGKSTPNPQATLPPQAPASTPGATSTPQPNRNPFAAVNQASVGARAPSEDVDDILAAFDSAAPVDASSHYPPQASQNGLRSHRSTPAPVGPDPRPKLNDNGFVDNDDDPFGLGQMSSRQPAVIPQPTQSSIVNEDDDILGALGRPVEELPPRKQEQALPRHGPSGGFEDGASHETDPRDKAVAELVDMGFPADKSAEALARTESGLDVQAAVGWLLNQAHEEARQKSRARTDDRGRSSPASMDHALERNDSRRSHRNERSGETMPAWMREQGSRSGSAIRRHDNHTPTEEKDVAQYASEIGSSLIKSANSLWKTGQKKMQKAVAEFQQEGDPNQPKWMRDARTDSQVGVSSTDRRANNVDARSGQQTPQGDATDEAMMLDSIRPEKVPRPIRMPETFDAGIRSRGQSPASAGGSSIRSARHSPFPQESRQPRASGKLTREDVDEQSAQAYVKAFKRGDYAAAHAAYTSALSPLPSSHPINIIILCNRALTAIKTGEPKAAIADADSALGIIGPSRGEGERIVLDGIEGEKDMKDFFGKALMRKAEALEHLEKWADAAKVWKEAVEAGVGGAVSISGRNRCDKAVRGESNRGSQSARRPAAAARANQSHRPAAASSGLADVAAAGRAAEEAAVQKMRAANAAAEKVEDEKFALSDQVEAKLISWKGGKADNLRALLGSLDTVLWEEAGWKKVGMADLVMPNKVKIVYMKAIGRVHPDKVPQTATTEQRMISAAVFATLNEAWDKFKRDNGL
ncbi:hypothetical protein K490DRAFT_41707 [Saccharata proteae CBS 121410]|uniref:UBA domain-containing protein n=1 Tax=Saccharata proteae CBS 121410 TaxID=1314787 RepID=A0A9P4LX13_9PEZI|nr:hypothetical protein K490DRAFT_41707 [Saccharata proteae CBS 121410]